MATTDDQRERVPLAEAWRHATGQEPPELTEAEIADVDAKIDAARQRRQQVYGRSAAA